MFVPVSASIITHAAVTSVALGYLRSRKVIQVNSKNLKNPTARRLFDSAVDKGESVVHFFDDIIEEVNEGTKEFRRRKAVQNHSRSLKKNADRIIDSAADAADAVASFFDDVLEEIKRQGNENQSGRR